MKYAIPLQNHNTNQFTFNYNGSRYGLNLNYRYSKALSGTVCGGYDVMIEQAMKYIETLQAITEGQNNKVVYMPYEATGVLSSIDGIKQMLDNK